VIGAARLAGDGETFIRDMGEPVRIVDIVHAFANLIHRPDVDIQYTGMRDGEKLSETLFCEHEQPVLTEHPQIYRSDGAAQIPSFRRLLRGLYDAAEANDRDAVRSQLRDLLPEYRPAAAEVPAMAAPYADDY
jgi:FlaA1/EpsC-like NDP-sugar epimerase